MLSYYRPIWHLMFLATLLAAGSGKSLRGAEPAEAAAEPFARVYDAPPASVSAIGEGALPIQAWFNLPENNLAHRFQGCAVLMNDRLVAVLRLDGLDLDVYCRQARGVKRCARLQPICGTNAALKRASLTLKENTPNAVSVEVGFSSPRGEAGQIGYELNAAAPFIKTTASAGVKQLRVQARSPFAVLPDFFGDDMIIAAAALPVRRAELPSENFLLHLMHGGDTLLLTVSESRDNEIEITLSDSQPREIIHSDIAYGSKPHVWVAVLSEPGLWHQRLVAEADADKEIKLDWKMPYPALWRVDWTTRDRLTDSWEMLCQRPDGKYVMAARFGQDPTVGQRSGDAFGGRDWNKPNRQRWNPVLSTFSFPCWIDREGQGYLQPLAKAGGRSGGAVAGFVGPVVIYPMDRTPEAFFATPLDKLTVVDLVRMTLGVGPCQYILDL